jgi:hypothetical protein
MSNKTSPKKLRNGPVIAVDNQIVRWRKSLKKRGILLGRGMEGDKKRAEEAREARTVDTNDKLLKKRFF